MEPIASLIGICIFLYVLKISVWDLAKCNIITVYPGKRYRRRKKKYDCPYDDNDFTVTVKEVKGNKWINYSHDSGEGKYFNNEWMKKEIFNYIFELDED